MGKHELRLIASSLALAVVACEGVPDVSFSPPADASIADATDDADPPSDATDDGASLPPTLPCGDAGPCDFATSTCCLTKLGFECVIRGTACGGVDLQCNDIDDCTSAKVCCAARGDDGGAPKKFTCVAPNGCTNTNGALACDPDAATCAAGTSCTSSSIDGYSTCQ